MRNLRVVRRGDDMPLYGTVKRVGKGRYEVVIKFVTSKRTLHKEQLSLPNREAVQRFYEREFPTLTWGEPKYVKPRLKVVRSKPPKKVTRKGKPTRKRARKPRKKQPNAIPHTVRLRRKHRKPVPTALPDGA
jgi:hypothetical protein